MLYSFDVFDTLITRTTATPCGIFTIVNHKIKLMRPDIAERLCGDFYNIRVAAERYAQNTKKVSKAEEITFDDIYLCMMKMTALLPEDICYLKLCEYETEKENIIGINSNIQKVKALIEKKERVILISDMYYSAEQIRNLLLQVDCSLAELPLYVSSEAGLVKGSGNLYRYVRSREYVNFHNWKHIGDNEITDIKVPESLGMQTEKYEYEKLLECEQTLLSSKENDINYQLFVGSSRNCRVERGNATPTKLGTAYGAAIILYFALWVLNMCKKKNLKDIFFVARDGAVVWKVAQLLIPFCNGEYHLHYIHGSRKAWRVSLLGDEECYNPQKYLESTMNDAAFSIQDAADCLNISSKQLAQALQLTQIDVTEKIDWKVSFADKNLFNELNSNESIKTFLLKNHSFDCNMLMEYLKSKLTADDVAFVDLVGTGMTQDIIADFTKKKLGVNITSLFFSRSDLIESEYPIYDCVEVNSEHASIMEALTRSLEGRTIGYKKVKNKIIPLFTDDDNVLLTKYGYQEYLESIYNTVSLYIKACLDNKLELSNVLGREYYNYLIDYENGELLDYICKMPVSNNFLGKERTLEFAPVITDEIIEDISKKEYIDIDSSSLFLSMKKCSKQQRERMDILFGKIFSRRSKRAEDEKKAKEEENRLAVINRPHSYRIEKDNLRKRIVLYGAGDIGSCLYNVLDADVDIKIVAWVDRHFTEKDGIKDSVEHITDYDFDQIVIAVRDPDIVFEIKCDLHDMGIPLSKMYWEYYITVLE